MVSANPSPANRRFVDEAGNRIAAGERLGEGGEGVVYRVQGQPNSVMKIWKPGKKPQDADAKLAYMVSNRVEPELGATWRITWPQHVVRENGATVGYTMPLLPPSDFWEPMVEYYNRRAAESTEQEQGRELRIDDRIRMARNLALGFRAVHAAGYVIGDVNEKNVEVNRQNDIAMVDCDSYGFTDAASGRLFSNHMGRPEFQAPEVQDDYANRTQEQDLFGLSVLIFHLLTGSHPHIVTNRPDHNLTGQRIKAWLFPPADRSLQTTEQYWERWRGLHPEQQELFQRCFNRRRRGKPRPTPEEWIEALAHMPQEWTGTSQSTQTVPAPPAPPTGPQTQPPRQQQQQTQPPRRRQQQTQPPRQQRQRPAPQQTQPPPQQPPSRQPQPTPQQPQPQPDPPAVGGSSISKRAKLVLAAIGVSVAIPILFWLFSGVADDESFPTAANVAAGGASVPAAAPPEPTRTPRPTIAPTNTAIPMAAVIPTNTPPPAPTSTRPPPPTSAPPPALAPTPEPTLAPEPTTEPTPTVPPDPVGTPIPTERLIQHPAHPKVTNAVEQAHIYLQGCYLGNQKEARRFRLASWDVWDPSRYGAELKFVKIITNTGARLPLERGACYGATVVKQVDSTEEYVCLDRDSAHPQQSNCADYSEGEVIPTFILYPDNPDDPNDFTENFEIVSRP